MTDDQQVAAAVEAHIAERIKVGKQPSKSEIAWMRSWPGRVANGEPHPWYGPCDGLGTCGECSECERRGGDSAMTDEQARGKDDSACPDCYIAGSIGAFRQEHEALLARVQELERELAALREASA